MVAFLGLVLLLVGPRFSQAERRRLNAQRTGLRIGAPNRASFYAGGVILIVAGMWIAFSGR